MWETKHNSMANMFCFFHNTVNCGSMPLDFTVADTRHLIFDGISVQFSPLKPLKITFDNVQVNSIMQ